MTVSDLLLTDERQAQLTEALANTGVSDPLATCIAEATADVARFTTGYVIAQLSLDGWTRAIAIWKAYTLIEGGVPEDVQRAYDAAMEELRAIAKGERPNLPTTPDDEDSPSAWGSAPRIAMRSDNTTANS